MLVIWNIHLHYLLKQASKFWNGLLHRLLLHVLGIFFSGTEHASKCHVQESFSKMYIVQHPWKILLDQPRTTSVLTRINKFKKPYQEILINILHSSLEVHFLILREFKHIRIVWNSSGNMARKTLVELADSRTRPEWLTAQGLSIDTGCSLALP